MYRRLLCILICMSTILSTALYVFAEETNIADDLTVDVICSEQSESDSSVLYDGISASDKSEAFNMGKITENSFLCYGFFDFLTFNTITVRELANDLKIDKIVIEYAEQDVGDEDTDEEFFTVLYEGSMPDNGVLTVKNEFTVISDKVRIRPLSYKPGKSGDIYISEFIVSENNTSAPDTDNTDDGEEIQDDSQNTFSPELKFLQSIGIAGDDDKSNDLLTRGEFASWISKLVKYDTKNYTSQLKLKDITSAHPYYNDILFSFGMGYMSVKTAGSFKPDDYVTLNEASEALLALLGYKPLILSGSMTGLSQYSGLISNVNPNSNGELTGSEAAKLIVNAMETDIVEKEYPEDKYYISKGKNLLNNLWKISTTQNVITATDSTSVISSLNRTEKNKVMLGSTLFECSIPEIRNYTGRKVKVYYNYNADTDTPTILYFYDKSNKVLNLLSDEIISVTGEQIIYTPDDINEKTVEIKNKATFIYNNKIMKYLDTESLIPENGEITLIDNDGSGFSVVIIKNGIDFLVSDVYDNKIVFKNENYTNSIALDDDNGFSITKNGNEVGLNEVKPNNVITVYPDKFIKQNGLLSISDEAEYFEIKVSDNIIKGTINVIAENLLTIDDSEYKMSSKFMNNPAYAKKSDRHQHFILISMVKYQLQISCQKAFPQQDIYINSVIRKNLWVLKYI